MEKMDCKTLMIIKCRAIFLQSIAILFGENIMFDDDFRMVLKDFMANYIQDNFDKFSLIYYFKVNEKNELSIYEDEEWRGLLNRYLNYFFIDDVKNIIKLYDDVGQEKVDKISELTELFYEYIKIIGSNKVAKIKC